MTRSIQDIKGRYILTVSLISSNLKAKIRGKCKDKPKTKEEHNGVFHHSVIGHLFYSTSIYRRLATVQAL